MNVRIGMRRAACWTLAALAFGSLTVLAGEGTDETATTALAKLKEGNGRFCADEPAPLDLSSARRAELAKGQRPRAVVLTCADSRVAPEHLFGAGLGELFVLRVAGNVTDECILGSIEYAVEHLKTPLIVVLGHSKCGAVSAALGKDAPHGNLGALVKAVHVGTGLPDKPDDRLDTAIRNNAEFQAGLLTEKSDVIRDAVQAGRVTIATAVYDLASGRVAWLPARVPTGVK